jgi:hypothetical protein
MPLHRNNNVAVSAMDAWAYGPRARPLPARYLMAVAPFARLVQDTTIDREQVVLDIGCSCGYSSAVLSLLSSSAIVLEEDGELMTFATRSLSHAQAQNITIVTGPLNAGWTGAAPSLSRARPTGFPPSTQGAGLHSAAAAHSMQRFRHCLVSKRRKLSLSESFLRLKITFGRSR